jgi:hypothetical protein
VIQRPEDFKGTRPAGSNPRALHACLIAIASKALGPVYYIPKGSLVGGEIGGLRWTGNSRAVAHSVSH